MATPAEGLFPSFFSYSLFQQHLERNGGDYIPAVGVPVVQVFAGPWEYTLLHAVTVHAAPVPRLAAGRRRAAAALAQLCSFLSQTSEFNRFILTTDPSST